MASATVVFYVDPNAVGTGSGTNWVDAYNSLSAFEAARQKVMTCPFWVYCRSSGGTADTAARLYISGWTIYVSTPLVIEAASTDWASPEGIDTSNYRLDITDPTSGVVVNAEDCVTLRGLQIIARRSALTTTSCVQGDAAAVSNKFTIDSCYLKTIGTVYSGVYVYDVDAKMDILNTVIDAQRYGISADMAATVRIFNTTVHGGSVYGIRRTGGTFTVKNTAVFDSGDDFSVSSGAMTIDYCASDDGDGTNAQTVAAAIWSAIFTSVGSGNFTLKNYIIPQCCVGKGVDDPGAGLYSDDMRGRTRTSTWDIGADEYIATTAVGISALLSYYNRRRRVA